jgi:hypothetical protein
MIGTPRPFPSKPLPIGVITRRAKSDLGAVLIANAMRAHGFRIIAVIDKPEYITVWGDYHEPEYPEEVKTSLNEMLREILCPLPSEQEFLELEITF